MLNFKLDLEQIDKIGNFSKEEKNFRHENLKNFNNIGFPSKKYEDWKFLDLKEMIAKNFTKLDLKIRENKRESIELIKDFDHNSIVLVNGKLFENDFRFEDSKQIKLEPFYNNTFSENNEINSLVYLNRALSNNGFYLKVNDNYKFKKILVIYNLFTEDLSENILNSRNEIIIGENAELHTLDYVVNKSKKNFFNNVYEKLTLNKQSVYKNIIIQNGRSKGYFYKYSKNDLSSKSSYTSYFFPTGLRFNKSDLEINLNGENIECNLQAASFLHEGDNQEIKTRLNHFAPDCKSYQKVKNVLNTNSKGVYQGKIFVKDVAQKTDAYQLSKALLLDDNSEFSSKPELEIYADDVKCSHGSTSGNVEDDSIYYLMTRGLSKKESVKILVSGFLSEIIDSIQSNSLKNFIKTKLENQIYEH